jgi:hypothetical protein
MKSTQFVIERACKLNSSKLKNLFYKKRNNFTAAKILLVILKVAAVYRH